MNLNLGTGLLIYLTTGIFFFTVYLLIQQKKGKEVDVIDEGFPWVFGWPIYALCAAFFLPFFIASGLAKFVHRVTR